MNGNTATPDAASLMRNVQQRVRTANDDELDASLAPTVVVPPSPAPPADLFFGANIQPDLAMLDDDGLDDFVPATVVHAPTSAHQYMGIEERLETLFARGEELATTLVRPDESIDDMGLVAATKALKRHILSLVPAWHNRPVMLEIALGALAVFHLRPSDYTPVEEVNILWALEGNSIIRARGGVLYTYHGFSWRKFEGVFSSSALRRIKRKMMALEVFTVKLARPPRAIGTPFSIGLSPCVRPVMQRTTRRSMRYGSSTCT